MKDSEKDVRDGDDTLTDRGNIYGPYTDGLYIREGIMAAIVSGHYNHHQAPMSDRDKSYFWDIANKLSRLAICPNHEDSWNDIVGYAKLIHNAVLEGDYK